MSHTQRKEARDFKHGQHEPVEYSDESYEELMQPFQQRADDPTDPAVPVQCDGVGRGEK